jgi:hypothetical protein
MSAASSCVPSEMTRRRQLLEVNAKLDRVMAGLHWSCQFFKAFFVECMVRPARGRNRFVLAILFGSMHPGFCAYAAFADTSS